MERVGGPDRRASEKRHALLLKLERASPAKGDLERRTTAIDKQ